MVDHGGAVAGGEDQRIGLALQGVADADEASVVERQAGVAQPGGAAGLRDPDDLVGGQHVAGARLQAAGRRPAVTSAPRWTLTPRSPSTRSKALRTAALCVGRICGVGREQVEAQLVGVAPQRAQLVAQPVLHGQGQFDAAGAGADHGDRRRARHGGGRVRAAPASAR